MRHGTTRSRNKLVQPSNSTNTGRSSTDTICSVPGRNGDIRRKPEPVEAVGRDRQQVRQFADGRKRGAPSISTGTRPLNAARFSSTGCAERERLTTHKMVSSPNSAQIANILRLPGLKKRRAAPRGWSCERREGAWSSSKANWDRGIGPRRWSRGTRTPRPHDGRQVKTLRIGA